MQISREVCSGGQFWRNNYGSMECHKLSSDLIKTQASGDHHMPKTYTRAESQVNRSNGLTCSVLTRSSIGKKAVP